MMEAAVGLHGLSSGLRDDDVSAMPGALLEYHHDYRLNCQLEKVFLQELFTEM